MRKYLLRPVLFMVAVVALFIGGLGAMTFMPGTASTVLSRGLNEQERATRAVLRRHVGFLASSPRNLEDDPEHTIAVTAFIEKELRSYGLEPTRQAVTSKTGTSHNIIVRRVGTTRPEEIVVVGAHWDTRGPTPGADDNGSGVAALLDLSKWIAGHPHERTLEIAFWANEEPPHFQTDAMGSLVHARSLRAANSDVVQMLSLEMLGYYDDEIGSQKYPPVLRMFYPEHGAFIAFVGSMWHRGAVTAPVKAMRAGADFPVYGFAGPEQMPGIGFSDQWSFWQEGYPGAMLTDTSYFRTPHYHQLSDTADTLDYDRFARVVVALRPTLTALLR